jgi:enoyl-CoA hydratase/carnithine racemase
VLTDLVGRGTAMDLALTGRWVGAAEALAMGLVNRVEDEPGPVAAAIAEDLAAQGHKASARVKSVTAAGGLLDRLHAERQANRAAWTQVIASAGG